MNLSQLAKELNAELTGDGEVEISSAATLEEAQAGQISFLANPKYTSQLETTRASAVIVAPNVKSDRVALIKAKDPYYAFTQAVIKLHGFRKHPFTGIHPLAHVDPTAVVGEGTVIYPFCFVGPRAKIGRDCILYPNVTVYDDCVLGDRVTLHAGCSIGHDGFGFATHAGTHHKIPQIGNVVLEDDVELGANCAVDRATLGSTVIGRGTKFSNEVVIGHGTKIGAHCLFVAQVGIAGSVNVGNYVVMGGQVGVAGHLKIGDQVQIAAQSGVMNDLEPKQNYLGGPAMPISHARRVYNHFMNLPELVDRIKELEKKMAELEKRDG
jgi:UDP-3-O-[3-hydroxymyristoyl] glucosamine N-acyltransferase